MHPTSSLSRSRRRRIPTNQLRNDRHPAVRSTSQPQPVLASDASAALRDQLIAEIAELEDEDELALWAHQQMRSKNSLTPDDARALESIYQLKLNGLNGEVHYDLQKPRAPSEAIDDSDPVMTIKDDASTYIKITPTNDANFTLQLAATAKDAEGNMSTTTVATEAVTVNPLAPTVAPVAASGIEGQAIAIDQPHTETSEAALEALFQQIASLKVGRLPFGVGTGSTEGAQPSHAAPQLVGYPAPIYLGHRS